MVAIGVVAMVVASSSKEVLVATVLSPMVAKEEVAEAAKGVAVDVLAVSKTDTDAPSPSAKTKITQEKKPGHQRMSGF